MAEQNWPSRSASSAFWEGGAEPLAEAAPPEFRRRTQRAEDDATEGQPIVSRGVRCLGDRSPPFRALVLWLFPKLCLPGSLIFKTTQQVLWWPVCPASSWHPILPLSGWNLHCCRLTHGSPLRWGQSPNSLLVPQSPSRSGLMHSPPCSLRSCRTNSLLSFSKMASGALHHPEHRDFVCTDDTASYTASTHK